MSAEPPTGRITSRFTGASAPAAERRRWYDFRCQARRWPEGRACSSFLASRGLLEPSEETEPVTATVDHADIRGLVTTLLVSVAAPASL